MEEQYQRKTILLTHLPVDPQSKKAHNTNHRNPQINQRHQNGKENPERINLMEIYATLLCACFWLRIFSLAHNNKKKIK